MSNHGKYQVYSLQDETGRNVHLYAHRLVAAAFIENPNNYPHINHKDGNPLNNHYSNLEWCTPKQNSEHAWKTGLASLEKANEGINARSRGRRCATCGTRICNDSGLCASCSADQGRRISAQLKIRKIHEKVPPQAAEVVDQRRSEIVALRLSGLTHDAIAKRYGITRQRVQQIVGCAAMKHKRMEIATADADAVASVHGAAKKLIEGRGVKLRHVSEKTGIDYGRLHRVLNGGATMSIDDLFAVCDYLNVSPDFFYRKWLENNGEQEKQDAQ